MTVRIFVALMQRDPHVRELVAEIVPDVFPWVAFLSRDEVREFVAELVSTMRAADAIDNPTPVVQVIDGWRHTAKVLADPELTAALIRPSDGDFGPVPSPASGSGLAPKRGDRLAPSAGTAVKWELRFATSEAVRGWEALCQQAPANTAAAWQELRSRPGIPMATGRHHRLKARLASGVHRGVAMEQWQYEITSGGRLWYLVDVENAHCGYDALAPPTHPPRTSSAKSRRHRRAWSVRPRSSLHQQAPSRAFGQQVDSQRASTIRSLCCGPPIITSQFPAVAQVLQICRESVIYPLDGACFGVSRERTIGCVNHAFGLRHPVLGDRGLQPLVLGVESWA